VRGLVLTAVVVAAVVACLAAWLAAASAFNPSFHLVSEVARQAAPLGPAQGRMWADGRELPVQGTTFQPGSEFTYAIRLRNVTRFDIRVDDVWTDNSLRFLHKRSTSMPASGSTSCSGAISAFQPVDLKPGQAGTFCVTLQFGGCDERPFKGAGSATSGGYRVRYRFLGTAYDELISTVQPLDVTLPGACATAGSS
jgi:hypothetical protein